MSQRLQKRKRSETDKKTADENYAVLVVVQTEDGATEFHLVSGKKSVCDRISNVLTKSHEGRPKTSSPPTITFCSWAASWTEIGRSETIPSRYPNPSTSITMPRYPAEA